MDAVDQLILTYCSYCAGDCGMTSPCDWESSDISKLIALLDAELQRREHAKNV